MTELPIVLPLSELEKHDPCKSQMEIVRREWPDGIPLTDAAATRAVELRLDIDWAAEALLSPPAWAEYERVMTPPTPEEIRELRGNS